MLWSYEYMKIIYVNCGVKNYMKGDHRSCRRNFCSCEEKAWFFSRLSFRNCKSCVHNCDDLLSYNYVMLCYVMLRYVMSCYVMLCEWLNINKQINEIKWTLLSTRWGIAWRHRERLLKRLRQVKLHPFSQVLVSHWVTQSINKWISFPRNWSKRNVKNSNTLQYFHASFESFLNTSLTREVQLLWVCQLKLVLWRRVLL